ELTQETFFKALQAIDGFDGTCKLYVWLCQIAKNAYFSAYKADRRLDHSAADTRVGPGPEGALLHRESAMEAHQALHRLTEPYKEVFSLRLFGELSFAQIGALFGKTESWARVTYHRARLKIREDLP
ncbi:MAG: sigma-70 family RNA polymerase sigma factor, partial [Oscillibacter sp.]